MDDDNYNKELIANYFLNFYLENTPIQIFNIPIKIPINENGDFYQKKRLYEQIEQNNDQNDDDNWKNNEDDKKNINPSKKQKINTSSSTKPSELKIDGNKKKFICHICQKTYTSSSNLNQHLITHEKNKPFKCTYCLREFNRKQHLMKHEEIHIKQEIIFQCTYKNCNKTFICEDLLKKHLQKHTQEKISCPQCSNKYISRSGLRQHLKKYHT